MGQMVIRIGADDIEKVVLGANPTEEARLEFRNAVLCAYAEAHVKPLENSESLKKLKASLSAELDVVLERYVLDKKGYNLYVLKPQVKEAVRAEADAMFEERFKEIISETRDKLGRLEADLLEKYKAVEQRIEKRLAAIAGHMDGEGFIAESFTKSLNEHMNKLIRGRSLDEIEMVTSRILANEKKAGKK